jgi:hypothetical protein
MASEWDDALTLCERNGRQGEHERARACRRRLHVRFFVNTGLGWTTKLLDAIWSPLDELEPPGRTEPLLMPSV